MSRECRRMVGWCAICLQILWCVSVAHAELIPSKGPVDGRVRTTSFDPDQVYRLRGYIGYQIDLEFETGEVFAGMGAGDIEALSFFGQENHLFLKPKAARVATNLTVLTNRRRYQFDYLASPRRPDSDDQDVIYALRFVYPVTASAAAADEEKRRIDVELAAASTGRGRNIDYWYCGEAAIRPIAASDDGVHTRLRFAANAELPAVFVRNEDGSESLLNFSMDAGDVVLHRVAHRLVLRRGRLTGCIINQGFAGSGVRLESGPVAPTVERAVQRATP